MHRQGQIGLILVSMAMTAGAAEARPMRRLPPVSQQPGRPHLVIVEAGGGFVIRCETPHEQQNVPFPRGAVPLGASVRIDRTALLPSNAKDISHGETR